NLTVNTSVLKTYSGAIQDGGLGGGVAGSFTKNGTGTLFLTGASTYTGATTINNGFVFVNGSLGNTAVTANGGGLGGSGSITGAVTINHALFLPGSNAGFVG